MSIKRSFSFWPLTRPSRSSSSLQAVIQFSNVQTQPTGSNMAKCVQESQANQVRWRDLTEAASFVVGCHHMKSDQSLATNNKNVSLVSQLSIAKHCDTVHSVVNYDKFKIKAFLTEPWRVADTNCRFSGGRSFHPTSNTSSMVEWLGLHSNQSDSYWIGARIPALSKWDSSFERQ